jgi:hypothetical protein
MDTNTSYQTLSSNSMKYMLKFVGEYESVKKGEHTEFQFVKSLFEARGFCSQNFTCHNHSTSIKNLMIS